MRKWQRPAMILSSIIFLFFIFKSSDKSVAINSESKTTPASVHSPVVRPQATTEGKISCPSYSRYSSIRHAPFSSGTLRLAFQRPVRECRTFQSPAVEKVIENITSRMKDSDLARIFENCFPNTLDTTIRWHARGELPKTFIITGDINAQWLRDSANQLQPYIELLPYDENLRKLVLGAIRIQADYITSSPYCNAFNPPPESKIPPAKNGLHDLVFPPIDNSIVFECKYELDSLASFLDLSNHYYAVTGDTNFMDKNWTKAIESIFNVIRDQEQPTFQENNRPSFYGYSFQRSTTLATETLALNGIGYPVNMGTLLIKSSFRPSDDATILPFFIPGNAMMCVQLEKISDLLSKIGREELAAFAQTTSSNIRKGIEQHAIFEHPVFGKMYAYEVDGYGGQIVMDDANIPSLLSLPRLGFLKKEDPIYQNTRRAVLSKRGNPYYVEGSFFKGIGSPHVGLSNAWPMSLIQQISTTDDDNEILELLTLIKESTFGLGLIHESINVNNLALYTRPWFSWANSEFSRVILDLAKRKPGLIFEDGKPFDFASIFEQV